MSLTPCIITHIPTKKVVSVEEALDLVWNDPKLRGIALDLIAGTEKKAEAPKAEEDPIEAYFKSLLDQTKNTTGLNAALYRGMVQAILSTYQAGKNVAKAIQAGIDYLIQQGVSQEEAEAEAEKIRVALPKEAVPPPPVNEKPEPTQTGGEGPKMVEKAVVNRAYKGTKDERLQAELEKLGLYRPVYDLEEITAKGQRLFEQLGIEGSLNALENQSIDTLTRLGIHRALTDDIQQKLEQNTDPDQAAMLIGQQALAMNLGQKLVSAGGLSLRYWKDTLENSIVPYDYESKVKQMREDFSEYYQKHKEKIEADFKLAQEIMDKANADRQKLDNDIAEWELKKSIEGIQESVNREKKRSDKPVKTTFIKQERYETAKKRLAEALAYSGANPALIPELAVVAAYHIEKGARSFARFSKQMIEEYGDKIKPYLKDAYDAGLEELKKAPKVVEEVEIVGDDIKVPHSLMRQYVEEGITDPKELVKKIYDDLKGEYPDITERQIRDAISGYGKQVNPTGDQIDKEIRELKSLMQKISQLEDLEKQIRPLKTGKQRDAITDRQRELQKQVREKLQLLPQTKEDTDKLLKTALDTIKTRLRNEITDLQAQIDKKEKTPVSERGPRYDIEELVLKDQRDDRKRVLDELTANPEKELEERIQKALDAIEESTKRYEDQIRRIKAGLPIEDGSTNPLIPDTPELKAAKDARDALRKEKAALLKVKPKSQEEIKLEKLQKELDSLLQGIVEDKDAKVKKEDSPAVKALKDQINRQKEMLGLVQAKRTPEQLAHDNAVAAKERRIAELNNEIANLEKGQEKTKVRKEAKRSDVIKSLDDKIKANNETLADLRKSAGITERERLKAWKEAAKEKTEWYQRRRAKGDYSTKPRKAPPEFDKEAERIELEKFRAKELYDDQFRKAQDAKRGAMAKFLDYAYDAGINVVRGINAGIDLGIILIQGLSLALKNPQHVPMALKRLALAGVSEKNFLAQTAKIKNDPLYMAMRKSKLSITEPHAHEAGLVKEESGFNSLAEEIWDEGFGLPERANKNVVTTAIAEGGKKVNPFSVLNRAQAAYMNTMRVEAFKIGAAILHDKGFTFQNNPEAFEQYADAVNTFSGRATIGGLERSKGWYKFLTAMFYSPRNWASILKTTTPLAFYHFGKMNAGKVKGEILSPAQKFAAETLLKQVAYTTAYMLIIKALSGWNDDDEEEKDKIYVNISDPLSSDYMKMKVNGQTYDPWGGRIQQVVLQSRIAAHYLSMDAAYTNSKTGVKSKLGEGMTPTPGALLGRNIVGKFGPIPSVGYNLLNSTKIEGEDWLRKTSDNKIISTKELVGNAISPMTFPTVADIYERQPAGLREFMMLQGILGAGINTLDEDRVMTSDQQARALLHPNEQAQSRAKELATAALQTGDATAAKEAFEKIVAAYPTPLEKYKAVKEVVKDATDEKDLKNRLKMTDKDLVRFFKVMEGRKVMARGKEGEMVDRMHQIADNPEMHQHYEAALAAEYATAKRILEFANQIEVKKPTSGGVMTFEKPSWMKRYEKIVINN